jgi:hypothetical protein
MSRGVVCRDYGTDKEQALYLPISGAGNKGKDDKTTADYYTR